MEPLLELVENNQESLAVRDAFSVTKRFQSSLE
jgi:hypothetical protein